MNGLMFGNANGGNNATGIGATGFLPYFCGSVPIGAKWTLSNGASFLNTPINTAGVGGTINIVFAFNGITIAAAGSSLPGISLIPRYQNSAYYIQAQVLAFHSGGTAMALALYEINSGYGPFGVVQVPNPGNGAESQMVTLEGIMATGSTFAANLQIQMTVTGTGGTAIIGDNQNRGLVSPIQWTVAQIA